MTSVQNRLQPLSGNKYWLTLLVSLFLYSCSQKITSPVKKEPEKVPEKPVEKPETKFREAEIALLVPFKLNEFNQKTATKADVERSAMAIDFYQGFKMGIDSAAATGLNFKLKVYDTRDNNTQLDKLLKEGSLNSADLIVGPVFPDGLKYIRDFAVLHKLNIVNPLSASHPSEFNNPNLISIVNNIDLHARKAGDFISGHYDPAQTVVVLINPKSPEDELMGAPIRDYFRSKGTKFVFQEYGSVFTMETKLIKGKKYVIIVSSSDRKFVVPTLDKLIKMKSAGILSPDVFGHPDWIRQNYSTDKLQALHATISSSYKIDYSNASVSTFIKRYRSSFHFEPGEYAFKGFDIGYYFGTLLARHGQDFMAYLTKDNYKGLHNHFLFVKDEQTGYVNTSLMLLRYENFALKKIE